MARYRGAIGILVVLAITNLVGYAARNTLVGVFDDLRARYHVNSTELGLLATVFILPHAVATLPFGWLGDRLDRRRVIAAGLLIAGLAGVLTPLTESYWTLGITRAVIGLGTAAIVPVANSILAQLFDGPEKARRISVFNLGLFIGGVLGITLGPPLGFPMIVIAFAIPCVVLAGVIVVLPVPEPPSTAGNSMQQLANAFFADARILLRIKTMRWVIASATTMAFSAGSYAVWLKDFLNRDKGMSDKAATELLGVSLLGGLAGILAGGQIADRMTKRVANGRLWTIVIGILGTIPPTIVSLQVQPGITLYISSILTLFFISWYHAPMAATVDDLAPPERRVAAQGLVIFTMHLLGTTPSAFIVGIIDDATGSIYLALWLPTVILLVAAGCMAIATRSFAADARAARH